MSVGQLLGSAPGTPIDVNLNVGMNAVPYGTCITCFFQYINGFRVEFLEGCWNVKGQLDPIDPTWGRRHDFYYACFDALQVNIHRLSLDAHNREHATG